MSDAATSGPRQTTNGDSPSILLALDPPSPAPPTSVIKTVALATGWPLVLVNAVPTGSSAEMVEEAGRRLADSAHTFVEQGIDARSSTLVGPPVDVILAEALATRAAMIVMVGRRHDVDGRPLLDSVTSALLKVVDRPVLVIPSGPGLSRPGFVAAVERLVDLIDRNDEVDRLGDLREVALERLPEQPERDRRGLDRRLRDALHRFETEHPSLTAAVNDVAYHLSGMGI